MRHVLVTGVGRAVPALLAAHLASTFAGAEVVGCDLSPFEPVDRRHGGSDAITHGHGFEFVRADTRNPSISTVLRDHQIDTIVHFGAPACGDAVFADAAPGPLAKELTVIGTMQLLAAASRHEPLRRLIVGSSAVVYPSTHRRRRSPTRRRSSPSAAPPGCPTCWNSRATRISSLTSAVTSTSAC